MNHDPSTSPTKDVRERIARAIYDAPNGIDGDQLADMLIEDDRITGGTAEECRAQIMAVCLHAADAAYAALTLSDHIAAVEAAGEHVVVPAEPTEAMAKAGDDWQTDEHGDPCPMSASSVYRAMLAARPRDV